MSTSSRFSYTQKLILRRMRRGAQLKPNRHKDFTLGHNTRVGVLEVEGLIEAGALKKTATGQIKLK